MLGVGETWLTSNVSDGVVSIPNYILLCKDAKGNIAKHGVCLYVKVGLRYSEVDILKMLVN